MPLSGFFESRWYGNSARQWLVALTLLVIIASLLFVTRRLLGSRLERLAKRTDTLADDVVLVIVRSTHALFLVAVSGALASRALARSAAGEALLLRVLVLVTLAQTALWATSAIGLWIDGYLTKRRGAADAASVTTIKAVGVVARLLVWVVIVLTALNNMGIDVTTLITGLGIGGIALALAVQNILSDVLAALAIVVDKPFDVGDFIVVETLSGTVEHIGLKTTRVRSLGGEQVIVSNNELLKSRIHNYKRMYERRVAFNVDVTHETPPELVQRIPTMVKEAVTAHQPVRFERSHFSTITDSSFRVETVYWMLDPDYDRYMDIQQTINLELLRRFRDEGIVLAQPARAVLLRAGDSTPARNITTGT